MIRLSIIILILTGCGFNPAFSKRTVNIKMLITDEDLMIGKHDVSAIAQPLSNPCVIKIERRHYNHETIGHEVRHCFEGFWHKMLEGQAQRSDMNERHRIMFD